MSKPNWSKLKDYRCPMPDCGALLRELEHPRRDQTGEFDIMHHCTACTFRIGDEKLSGMVVRKKLDPPDFIKELRKWG